MEGFIIANGGEVAKTVTNKCTHLISAETDTKKCADAEKKGVIVVDEAWVREQCGEDTEAMDEDDDEDDEDEDDDDDDEEEEDIPPPTAKKRLRRRRQQCLAVEELQCRNSYTWSVIQVAGANSGSALWMDVKPK